MASAPLEESGFDDDLESLLNYDVNAPDASNDKNAQPELKSGESSNQATTTNVDEEVKIVKKRQPVPKLDQARLLSPAGIPRLRKIHKEKLKLKGKGHEFSDIARLLNMYQLWLDDLYPRAKFADALLMIEKLGHSKTMQMLRKQWIDEGKPKPPVEDYDPPSDMDEIAAEDRPMTDDGPPDPPEAEEGREHGTRDRRDLDSTNNASDTVQTTAASHSGKATEMDEMDELDALLAEQEAASGDHVEPGQAGKNQGTATQAIPGEDDFADEMEAMEGMDVPW